LCNGQILPISSNTALFSLLGTFYGGNGTSNFGLPDLRGRVATGQGDGPGLQSYVIGETLGTESTTVLTSNMPSHTHNFNAVAAVGNKPSPASFYMAEGPKSGTPPHQTSTNVYQNTAPNTPLNIQSVSVNLGGAGLPISIMQPYLTVTYIIALQGIFPPRN
jgi:microcystin-dependent protein